MSIVRDYVIGDGVRLRVKFKKKGWSYIVPFVYMRKRLLGLNVFVRVYEADPVVNCIFQQMLKDEVIAIADKSAKQAEQYLRSWGDIK